MFRAILWSQWKWTRGLVLLTTAIAFGLPLASINMAADAYSPVSVISAMQSYGAMYTIFAAITGLLVAMAAWASDHTGRHTYALSLPLTRAQYAGMRYVSGTIFIGVTVAGLLAGSGIVAIWGAIPEGLHVYPLALTARFALACLVSYSLFFAISAGTPKTAGIILGAIAALILAQLFLALINVDYPLLERVVEILLYRPGVFSVFAGRWMLIDA